MRSYLLCLLQYHQLLRCLSEMNNICYSGCCPGLCIRVHVCVSRSSTFVITLKVSKSSWNTFLSLLSPRLCSSKGEGIGTGEDGREGTRVREDMIRGRRRRDETEGRRAGRKVAQTPALTHILDFSCLFSLCSCQERIH